MSIEIEKCIGCGKKVANGWLGRVFAMSRQKYHQMVHVINVGDQDRSGSSIIPLGEVYAKLCPSCCEKIIRSTFKNRDVEIEENKKSRKTACKLFLFITIAILAVMVGNYMFNWFSWLSVLLLAGLPWGGAAIFFLINADPEGHLVSDLWMDKLKSLEKATRTGNVVHEDASLFLSLFMRDKCASNKYYSEIMWDTDDKQIKESMYDCKRIVVASVSEAKDELTVPAVKSYRGSLTL